MSVEQDPPYVSKPNFPRTEIDLSTSAAAQSPSAFSFVSSNFGARIELWGRVAKPEYGSDRVIFPEEIRLSSRTFARAHVPGFIEL